MQHQAYGEVIRGDHYGARRLDFEPDVVYDIGAHVGMFTLLAAVLFPKARVVAVEPHPANHAMLQALTQNLPNVTCLRAALGEGRVFVGRDIGEAGQVLGFRTEAHYPMAPGPLPDGLQLVDVPTVTLELLARSWPGLRTVFKIDIEGEEESFILRGMPDAPLRAAEYVAMELHCNPRTTADTPRGSRIAAWVDSFRATHAVDYLPEDDRIVRMRKHHKANPGTFQPVQVAHA